MTPKLLSAEDLRDIENRSEHGCDPRLFAHIAALEADNAALIAGLMVCARIGLASESLGDPAATQCARALLVGTHPGAALLEEHRKEVEALRAFVEAFAETAEAAVRNQEARGHGGQHVSFHGDFACIQPSVTSRLRWWAREGRSALEGKVSGLLVRARNEGLEKAAAWAEAMVVAGYAPSMDATAASIRSMKEAEQ